jgi:hypothetical protein
MEPRSGDIASTEDVTFVICDSILLEKPDVLLLKRYFPVMPLLVLDISPHAIDIL